MEIEYLNILNIYSSYYSPWYPSNLPDLEISYKRLNFQFDAEARLWSFFLKHGGYHGFHGNEPGLLFLHFFCKSWSTLIIFSKHGRFHGFYGNWAKKERLGLFCRYLYSDSKAQTIALKNRLQLQFCSKSVQTLFLPFCLIRQHY